jgi:DNA polymerase III alpha subunit (gram-positive type)
MNGYKNEFIVYDLETGGLKEDKHALAEVGFIALNWDLEEVERYEKIIKPYSEELTYEPKALEVNKLTMEMINNGEDAEKVLDEVIKFLKESKKRSGKKPVLCGHNMAAFDNRFLRAFFECFKKKLDDYVEVESGVDTMWWARWRYPELVNYKLQTVLEVEKLYNKNSHTSMADTEATAELVKIMLRALRGESSVQKKAPLRRYREDFQF